MLVLRHKPGMAFLRIITLLLSVSFLVSCTKNNGFPIEAQEVLDETARSYYTSSWSGSTHFQVLNEIGIRNAWQARGVESGDMWCVELAVSGRMVDNPKEISAVWILIRQDGQSDWQAAALETISAASTIEKCEL
jgi:hypothetical protein